MFKGYINCIVSKLKFIPNFVEAIPLWSFAKGIELRKFFLRNIFITSNINTKSLLE